MVYKGEPTKDGRCWYFRCYKKDYKGNNKKYSSQKYKTKSEAQQAERLFLLERDNPLKKNFDLVAMSYFKYLESINKSSTVQSYTYDYYKHIQPFFIKYDISDITTKEIKQWHDYMNEKGLSIGFKNKVHAVLKNIFNYACMNYDLGKNVVQLYGRFKEKKDVIHEDKLEYITLEEFNKFISVINEPLWHCFFTTLFYTGCRKGELYALNWNDIDFSTNYININKTLSRGLNKAYIITSTKTNQNRKIKMNKTLINELKNYKNQMMMYNNFEDNWFVFGNTIPVSRNTVDRYKHKYFLESGVHEITLHQFRHSAVSLLINEMLKQDNNLDINKALFSLSSRFGHSPEVMLKTYAHFYEDKLQDPIVDILDNL